MAEPDPEVLDEIVHEGETAGVRGKFGVIERHHDGPGVDRGLVGDYARELESRRDFAFDGDAFLAQVDEHTTDSEWWDGRDRFYALGDSRLSQYPAAWHDELGGSTDVADYLEFVDDEDPIFLEDADRSAAAKTVSQERLVHVVEVVGGVDHETATNALYEARDRGDVVEGADQNPRDGVYLSEWVPDDFADEHSL